MSFGRVVRIASLMVLPGISLFADAGLEALSEAGHWKQVRSIVDPRFRSNPNDPQNLYWMSRVKKVFGDYQAAYELAKKAVTAMPGNADIQRRFAEASGAMAQRASLLKKFSYAKECKKAGEAALALDPKNIENVEFMANYYVFAPGIAGGDEKKAAELRKTAASLNPVRGTLLEVGVAMNKKDRGKVEALMNQSLAANPKSYLLQITAANLCMDPGNPKVWEAVKYAKNAMALEPKRVGPYATLARAYGELEKWPELDDIVAQAEKAVPDDLSVHYAAGRAMVLKGKELPKAEQCFKKYLSQEPEGGSQEHVAAHWRLSLVYEKMGRKNEAIAELETCLRLRPDFDEAKKDLKRLK